MESSAQMNVSTAYTSMLLVCINHINGWFGPAQCSQTNTGAVDMFAGRLGADPLYREVNGKSLASFRLAVKRPIGGGREERPEDTDW